MDWHGPQVSQIVSLLATVAIPLLTMPTASHVLSDLHTTVCDVWCDVVIHTALISK